MNDFIHISTAIERLFHGADLKPTSAHPPAPANMQTPPSAGLATEGCKYPDSPDWMHSEYVKVPAKPRAFEVGVVYSTRSICDHECIFRWAVKRRTEKSVWLQSVRIAQDGNVEAYGDITRRSIQLDYTGEAELVYPSGRYSMCPTLTADKKET